MMPSTSFMISFNFMIKDPFDFAFICH